MEFTKHKLEEDEKGTINTVDKLRKAKSKITTYDKLIKDTKDLIKKKRASKRKEE